MSLKLLLFLTKKYGLKYLLNVNHYKGTYVSFEITIYQYHHHSMHIAIFRYWKNVLSLALKLLYMVKWSNGKTIKIHDCMFLPVNCVPRAIRSASVSQCPQTWRQRPQPG